MPGPRPPLHSSNQIKKTNYCYQLSTLALTTHISLKRHQQRNTMPPPDPTKEQQDQGKAEAAALDNTLETIPDSDNDSSSSQQQQQQPGPPRQVIAVSVSKGPSAFFNLARKFLMTDEECDLSALEGAIVSAVDAAHLLERSQIATISRCVFVLVSS